MVDHDPTNDPKEVAARQEAKKRALLEFASLYTRSTKDTARPFTAQKISDALAEEKSVILVGMIRDGKTHLAIHVAQETSPQHNYFSDIGATPLKKEDTPESFLGRWGTANYEIEDVLKDIFPDKYKEEYKRLIIEAQQKQIPPFKMLDIFLGENNITVTLVIDEMTGVATNDFNDPKIFFALLDLISELKNIKVIGTIHPETGVRHYRYLDKGYKPNNLEVITISVLTEQEITQYIKKYLTPAGIELTSEATKEIANITGGRIIEIKLLMTHLLNSDLLSGKTKVGKEEILAATEATSFGKYSGGLTNPTPSDHVYEKLKERYLEPEEYKRLVDIAKGEGTYMDDKTAEILEELRLIKRKDKIWEINGRRLKEYLEKQND